MILKEMRNIVSRSDACFLLSTDKTDYIGTDEEYYYPIARAGPSVLTRLRIYDCYLLFAGIFLLFKM